MRSFSAFGSVLREDFNENDSFKYTDLYFQFKEKLKELFKRQIDLLKMEVSKINILEMN